MKKILFTFGTLFLLGAAVSAQSTVDSIAAKYKLQPMPDPLTVEKTFPVIGTYQLEGNINTTDATAASTATTTTSNTAAAPGNLMISLDPANKGIIWIEGLPQGRVKAYLRKSPSTYRIMAQTTESGKKVKEGVLHFEPTTNTVHIALGKTYDEADPIGVFGLTTSMNADASMNTTTGVGGVNAGTNTNTSVNTNSGTTSETETKVKTADGTKVKTEVENDGTVKVKKKTPTSKTKEKITFYTATKVGMDNTTTNTQQPQQNQPQQQQ